LSIRECGLGDTAAGHLFQEALLLGAGGVLRLREGINDLIVSGVILLIIRGMMLDSDSPCVLGSSPVAAGFNCQIVDTSDNSEETLFTPVRTPRVTDPPEWNTVLLAPTNDGNLVHSMQITSSIIKDTSLVVIKLLGHSDRASKGTTLVEFVHHRGLSTDVAVLINKVDVELVRNVTSLPGVTVTAH
jgi:hypothetical protein